MGQKLYGATPFRKNTKAAAPTMVHNDTDIYYLKVNVPTTHVGDMTNMNPEIDNDSVLAHTNRKAIDRMKSTIQMTVHPHYRPLRPFPENQSLTKDFL